MVKTRFPDLFFLLVALSQPVLAGSNCSAVASGNWSNPAIWDCGGAAAVPGSSDNVTIDNQTVLLDVDATIQSMTVEPSGNFDVGPSPAGLSVTSTTGNLSFDFSAIDLLGDLTLTTQASSDIILESVNGGFDLTLNSSGTTIFRNIGLNEPLDALVTDAAGTTVIRSESINTTDTIIFNDPVTLETGILGINTPSVEFMNTLDSAPSTPPTSLLIGFFNDFAAFHGDVGSINPLFDIQGSSAGTTLIAADVTVDGDAIEFSGPVLIDNNPTITHSGSPILSMQFNNTISRAAPDAQSNLTLSTLESGDIAFFDDVTVDNLIITEVGGRAGLFGNINTNGSQQYNGRIDSAGALRLDATFIEFNNTLRINGGELTVAPQSNGSIASGAISDNGNLIKAGNGDFILAANNTYTGSTTVNQGSLIIDGSTDAASNINVDGGILGGNGTANGMVDINNGVIAPGSSPGILNTGDLFADSNAVYQAELNGLMPGTEHDQLNATGTISLNNATLQLGGSYIPAGLNDVIVLINNDGADPATGIFADLPEGATINNNGPLEISYIGGDGNDVVLLDNEGVFFSGFEAVD